MVVTEYHGDASSSAGDVVGNVVITAAYQVGVGNIRGVPLYVIKMRENTMLCLQLW